ncbi:MAG: hydantoinase B/oxoprolinase family protein [Candidatus Moduliflexus flocculans]|nr:hydantoinase B/oxoprolinase family protein [Candidatus Moduliflexus flocculans]
MAGELEQAGLLVTVSSRLLPEYREFERTVDDGRQRLPHAGHGPLPRRARPPASAGPTCGSCSRTRATFPRPGPASSPSSTALSGPAGGVVGARAWPRRPVSPTSSASTWAAPRPTSRSSRAAIRRTHESRVGDFPIRLPIIDIHSVGAGGGSIASSDRGGSLRVGPQSAGADPGPACYGRGDLPTVTDANLCLGRLDPGLLPGRTDEDPPGAEPGGRRRAWPRRIGKSAAETALGIVAIANANMEKAIRVISVERGIDPRAFALLSFGGAGGMHAVEMAAHLGMPTRPRAAQRRRPVGLRPADVRSGQGLHQVAHEDRRPGRRRRGSKRNSGPWKTRAAGTWLEDGFAAESVVLERSLDLPLPRPILRDRRPLPEGADCCGRAFLESFHRRHKRLYSYRHDGGRSRSSTSGSRPWPSRPRSRSAREPRRRRARSRRPSSGNRQIHTGRGSPRGRGLRPGPGSRPATRFRSGPGHRPRVDDLPARPASPPASTATATSSSARRAADEEASTPSSSSSSRTSSSPSPRKWAPSSAGPPSPPTSRSARTISCAALQPRTARRWPRARTSPSTSGPCRCPSRPRSQAVTFEPGDLVILNDPYRGGTHLPDITCISPVFLARQARPSSSPTGPTTPTSAA